jgi:signal transduction histidine kinase
VDARIFMPQEAKITPFTPAAPLADSAPARAPAADEARRSFLRMVSHELRTPLNAIIGFSEIINQELCGPIGSAQYKEYAGLIGQSGHRLLKLVNQILDIVRLEGQAAELDLQAEALEPIVEAAFKQLRPEAEAAGVALVLEDEAGLPEVIADPRGLQTILADLLQNAVAYSPAGGRVVVRVVRDGTMAAIEVQDQGPGVPAADLERITRPFEQGQQALTRPTQGAGLGLPIVRLLADAMGGALVLRSPPGQGLTALVALPAA